MKRKRKSKPKVKRLTEAQTDEVLARMERNLYRLELENEAMRRAGRG